VLSPNKYVVFLGAGASVPLGLPTMVELSERFEETILDDSRYLKEVLKAKQVIKRNGFQYDVESLYTYLLGHADPHDSLKKAGPYAASVCTVQPISKLRRKMIFNKIRERLEEYMIKKCYIEEEHMKRRVKTLYNRFFAKISGVDDWENSEPDWDNTVFEIFTTNYDNAIEYYGMEIGQIPFIGYSKTKREKVRFLPEQYASTPAKIKLYKLHGSVELSLLKDDTVVAVEPPKSPGETHNGIPIKAKVMVYGPDKNLIAEPYFELLVHLKEHLKNVHECVVVGYSFRDPWVYQIFHDVISHRRQRTPWIEYVSPSATYTISKLPKICQSVKPVDQSFEQYLNLPEEE
jgi:hypothetical protein